MPPGVFWSPPLSLALGVPCQDLSGYVCAWLSQGVAKPSPSPLKDLYFLKINPLVMVTHPRTVRLDGFCCLLLMYITMPVFIPTLFHNNVFRL